MEFSNHIILLKNVIEKYDHYYDDRIICFENTRNKLSDEIKKQLGENVPIHVEKETIRIPLFQISDLNVFRNENDFREYYSKFQHDRPTYFLESPTGLIGFDANSYNCFNQSGDQVENYLIKNFTALEEFKKLLAENVGDYHAKSSSELVFVSTKNGVQKVGTIVPSRISSTKDYTDKLNKLKQKLSTNENFGRFLKEQITKVLANKNSETSLYDLFEKLDTILKGAEDNYNVFVSNFNFDDFKNELLDEKNKYQKIIQGKFSDLVNKLIGLPISISLVGFAVFRLKDTSKLFIWLLIIGYFCYSLLTLYFISILKKDGRELMDEFKNDINNIEDQFPLEDNQVTNIRPNINRKFDNLQTLSSIIYWILVCSFAAVTTISLSIANYHGALMILIFAFALILACDYLLKEKVFR